MKNPQSKKHSWKEVTRVFDNFPKCDHFFEFIGKDCKCSNCGLCLIGVFKLDNGKPVL